MKKIQIGVIGCGGIANGKHIPSLIANDVEIVALCDIIIEKAEETAKSHKLETAKVFKDYKDLLAIKDIDAVCICTPNSSHCEITVASLMSGKHVMCEKPMAMNYEEALQMIEASEKSGKLLTIGYQNRYRPDSLYLKKECEKGAFGDIYYARARALRRRAVPTWGVFLNEEKQGGGPLIDIGTHALDLTLFMMNNYEPSYAVGSVYHKLNNQTKTANAWGDWNPEEFTVEDSAFGFVVMKDGSTIIIESSWALNIADEGEAQTMICGTNGGADMFDGLRINGVNNASTFITRPNFKKGGVDFNSGKSFESPADLECFTFLEAIRGNGELIVKPEQAAAVTRILEGIYKSAATGKPYYFD